MSFTLAKLQLLIVIFHNQIYERRFLWIVHFKVAIFLARVSEEARLLGQQFGTQQILLSILMMK